ncbi:hypothetical protein N7539_008293 [Penicillium diatomitis]|uniref:Uncharacterized protein n=1 Tax=Penicillium diatomitis TaxID=2819901 RepID=A0A9X0BNI0_9EURO|nr:uncharacterized protein N7539_008293 [Penicillium diatomitis]KAJ5475227.1 hypothetical protein N7539_008293 [Penicillium diatomitis]
MVAQIVVQQLSRQLSKRFLPAIKEDTLAVITQADALIVAESQLGVMQKMDPIIRSPPEFYAAGADHVR